MAIIDFQPGADKAELLKQRDLLRAQLEQLNAAEPDEDSELFKGVGFPAVQCSAASKLFI